MAIFALMFYTVVVFHIRSSKIFDNKKVRFAANINMIFYVVYVLYIGLTAAEKIPKLDWMLMIPSVGLAILAISLIEWKNEDDGICRKDEE